MRPELLVVNHPSILLVAMILIVEILAVAAWLYWLRRRQAFTQDHLYVGIALIGLTAVVLAILLKLGRLEIKSYGAMLMIGFLAGTYTAVRLGRRRGVPSERLLDLGLVILVGAIVGARLAYVFITPGEPLLDIGQVVANGLGGLSFHGGLIGGFLTASAYMLLTRLDYWRVADSIAPAIALGYAITRIGCFLNGCCYGKPSDLPWAVTFPLSPDLFPRDTPVHPTQLYASLMGFALFGLLLLLARGNSLGRAGRLFMALLMLEGVERFVMEIFRFPDPGFRGGLTLAQIVSIAVFAVGAAGWFLLPKRPAVVNTAPSAEVAAAKS